MEQARSQPPDYNPPMSDATAVAPSIRTLVLFGLTVGGIRYILEFVAPAHTMYFGLYYAMPLALVLTGWTNAWGPIRWRPLFRAMALTGLIVWGTWNSLSYTTAQFFEWTHGRFNPFEPGQRALPIADGALYKVGSGLAQGLITSVAGASWMIVLGTLTIWLPGRLRSKSSA